MFKTCDDRRKLNRLNLHFELPLTWKKLQNISGGERLEWGVGTEYKERYENWCLSSHSYNAIQKFTTISNKIIVTLSIFCDFFVAILDLEACNRAVHGIFIKQLCLLMKKIKKIIEFISLEFLELLFFWIFKSMKPFETYCWPHFTSIKSFSGFTLKKFSNSWTYTIMRCFYFSMNFRLTHLHRIWIWKHRMFSVKCW